MEMEIPQQIGKYKILEKLGRGASGCVLKAQQEIIGRELAIKVVFTHLVQEKPLIIKRFKREGRLAASLIHPNIVPIFDIGESDGFCYYTMQYVAGTPMNKYIQENTLPLETRLKIFIHLCDALALAHSRGIIHRDLKPHNVILTKDYDPIILDFGIAKSLLEEEQMTREGNILGSVHYMAPEQAGSGDAVGTYTDVFGLGVMMYEMFTGRRPFDAPNVPELIMQRVEYARHPEKYRLLTMNQLDNRIPESLDKIVFRCLAPQTSQRYQDAGKLLEDLKKFEKEWEFTKKLASGKQEYSSLGPINKRISYVYPAFIGIAIFVILLVFGLAAYFTNSEKGFFHTLKTFQQKYEIFTK